MPYSLRTMSHFEFIKMLSEMVMSGSCWVRSGSNHQSYNFLESCDVKKEGQHHYFWVRFTPEINSNIIFGSIFEIGSPKEATLTIQGSL